MGVLSARPDSKSTVKHLMSEAGSTNIQERISSTEAKMDMSAEMLSQALAKITALCAARVAQAPHSAVC